MRIGFCGLVVLLAGIECGVPASAHHSNPLYFDMSKAVTLEGDVVRLESI